VCRVPGRKRNLSGSTIHGLSVLCAFMPSGLFGYLLMHEPCWKTDGGLWRRLSFILMSQRERTLCSTCTRAVVTWRGFGYSVCGR